MKKKVGYNERDLGQSNADVPRGLDDTNAN
jgi:hypothetical protein